jgi:hypothetical protein
MSRSWGGSGVLTLRDMYSVAGEPGTFPDERLLFRQEGRDFSRHELVAHGLV